MKKLLFLFVVLLLVACDDGNFDVPSFEFDNQVSVCGTYVLHIKNSSSTETLAITLSETDLPDTEGTTELEITAVRGVNYRIYNGAIGTEYFCQNLPPTEPRVIRELNAESGTIVLETSVVGSKLEHEISFSDLTFQDGQERIYFETFYFGVFSN